GELVSRLEARVLNRTEIQLQRQPLTGRIRQFAVGVDVVPSDDARERGRLREIGGGPASQELRQEVVVALHVVTVHAAWQRPAISVKCKCSVQVSIVVAGIDPGGFADQLEGSALEGPVRGPDAQGPLARRIVRAEISRAAELDAQ